MSTQTSTASKRTDSMAIASLAMAMLSLFIGPFGFIPAIICGHVSRRRISKDVSLAGRGLATAGLIVGYGFLALFVAVITWVVFFWHSYNNSFTDMF